MSLRAISLLSDAFGDFVWGLQPLYRPPFPWRSSAPSGWW
jgi:hypothetical protein